MWRSLPPARFTLRNDSDHVSVKFKTASLRPYLTRRSIRVFPRRADYLFLKIIFSIFPARITGFAG
ncbi:MAG: hypothetical protein C4527_03435 [Candidatus Omnitrophota bacterium]|nr:MAG: hypothetical protein C4527_03435 [Candidatus Omnitrophota bacterium]